MVKMKILRVIPSFVQEQRHSLQMMPFSATMETSEFLKDLNSVLYWELQNNSAGVPGKRTQLVLLKCESKDLKTNNYNKQNP